MVIETYRSCDAADPDLAAGDSFSPDASLEFDSLLAGPIYLKLTHVDETVGGDDLTYRLTVRDLSDEAEVGAVIIVAGRLKVDDPLQRNIHNVTQSVYDVFTARGYSDEDIFYLTTEAALPGHDQVITVENLRKGNYGLGCRTGLGQSRADPLPDGPW